MVRAHASRAEGLRFESDPMPWLNARSCCSPSSKWAPGGNTEEIKAARKGTGHPTSHTGGSGEVSSLTGTPLRTKVYGTTLT